MTYHFVPQGKCSICGESAFSVSGSFGKPPEPRCSRHAHMSLSRTNNYVPPDFDAEHARGEHLLSVSYCKLCKEEREQAP